MSTTYWYDLIEPKQSEWPLTHRLNSTGPKIEFCGTKRDVNMLRGLVDYFAELFPT